MSTPIQNNSEGLQRILQAVNSLPEAESGGVTVQKKSGSFTTSKGSATIDCGFSPDIFYFTKNEKDEGYTMSGCFAFAECTNTNINTTTWDRSDNLIDAYATRSTSGVTISMYTYDDSWKPSNYSGTFSYVAVKYT
jgi:hypothetical protein